MRAGYARLRLPDAVAFTVLLLAAMATVTLSDYRPRATSSARAIEAKVRSVREVENRRARAGAVIPAWDPYQFSGRPYLAAFDSQVAYPPAVLLSVAPVESAFAMAFVFHAWIAGIGAYLVARQLDVATPTAIVGGIGAMFATVAWPAIDLPHSVDAHRLAWIPLALAFTMRSVRRPSWWPAAGLVLTVAMVLLTASGRAVVYVGFSIVAWYLFTMLWPDPSINRRRLLVQLATLFILAVSLTAFQTLPAARLWLSAAQAGGFAPHDWNEESSSTSVMDKAPLDEGMAAAFAPLVGHRTLSACSRVVDEADLLALRIPSVGGFGGVFLADYARFVTIASGLYPEKPHVYAGIDGAGGTPARADLLRFLDVEYLLSCGQPDPDRWTPVTQVQDVGVYRNRSMLGRAVWTCPAQAIGRQELDYRLRRYRYDATLTLRGAGPLVHVRWAAGMSDDDRARAEAEFRILPERFLGDRTWQYELFDSTPATVQSIVTSPLVEDTAGVDRSSFAVVSRAPDFASEPKTEWLIGAEPCAETQPATVVTMDRPDGQVVVDVDAPRDGIVVFSEPFYPLRAAWVDNTQVEVNKVNLAFTGVPVTSGRHRLELRYDPRGVQAGWWLSLVAAAIWVSGEWRARSIRSNAP